MPQKEHAAPKGPKSETLNQRKAEIPDAYTRGCIKP